MFALLLDMLLSFPVCGAPVVAVVDVTGFEDSPWAAVVRATCELSVDLGLVRSDESW